ncbi:PAS-domain containing protein [Rhodoplanes sp. SY1]|uniref:PAS-domain containing protein n=1 Tax=Rhodoplanes sp. SY1 TaxID=3166646 RepID=UPI0038B698FA
MTNPHRTSHSSTRPFSTRPFSTPVSAATVAGEAVDTPPHAAPSRHAGVARVLIGLVLLITSVSALAVTATLAQGAPPAAAWIAAGLGVVTIAAIVAAAAALSGAAPRAGIGGDAAQRAATLDAATAAAAREQAQDAIRAERETLATTLNNLPLGVVGIDASMRLVMCNDGFLAMYGLAREAAEPGLPLEALLRRLARAGAGLGDAQAFVRWIAERRDGAEEFVLADGRVISITHRPLALGGWVSTHEDVTVRRRAEAALVRSEALLVTVLDAVPDAILAKDAGDRRYVLMNRAAEALLGVSRHAVLGRTAREIFPRLTAELITGDERAVLDTRMPVLIAERAIETPAAGARIVSARCLPVCAPDGEPQMLITMLQDRTGRVRHPLPVPALSGPLAKLRLAS